jgi:membrane protein involved in colicin uptake
MTDAGPFRSEQIERENHLLIGFATSLAVHGGVFGLWFLLGFMAVASHLATVEKLKELKLAERQRRAQEPTLVFVEVAPEQAAPEPPKEAKFYSSANARAANLESPAETTVPRIDGSQDKVVKTEDVSRPKAQPLQPSPPPEPEEKVAADETRSDPVETPGDLALAKTNPEQAQKRERPRRLADVPQADRLMAGRKMKQEGGVRRRASVSLDVKGTAFGSYDAAIIAAIQQRWYDLLDESSFPPRTGKVVIEFRLYYDGRITDLRVTEEDVGDILTVFCRRAISDPAPYAPWPSDMRRMVGKEYREVKFTFFYL